MLTNENTGGLQESSGAAAGRDLDLGAEDLIRAEMVLAEELDHDAGIRSDDAAMVAGGEDAP